MCRLASARNIRLAFEPGTSVGEYVNADRQRLQQVLLELLSNAIRFNSALGSVTISVELESEDRVCIAINDTGIGINAGDLARIFRPFERFTLESSNTGAGLGLALSQRLIEAMGGTIAVVSTPGQGSTFAIDLERALAPAELVISDAALASNSTRNIGKNTVLYIEDNVSNVKLMENIMEHRPQLELLVAMQGELGLDLACEHQPKLILLDLHLPDVPGHEVLRRLIADHRTREIPVVVISADATPGQINRLCAAGASGYLTKPFNVAGLLELLDEYVADQAVI